MEASPLWPIGYFRGRGEKYLGWEFDVRGIGMGFGDSLTFLAQAVEMKGDGLAHILLDFLTGPTGRHTAGQIRGIMRKIPSEFLR